MILPQTDAVPRSKYRYNRTVWTDEAELGKGFVRDGSKYLPSALDLSEGAAPAHFQPTHADAPAVSQSRAISVVDSAGSYAASVLGGEAGTFEAWGHQRAAGFQASSAAPLSASSITVTLRRSFLSDPLRLIKPSLGGYKLTDGAFKLITQAGVDEFIEAHGTHFVAGYTIGGVFNGFVQVHYWDAELAKTAESTVAQCVSKISSLAAEASNFESAVGRTKGFRSITAGYKAVGWNAASGPGSVTGMARMLEAADAVQVDDGTRLEAILVPYTELDDYRLAVESAAQSSPQSSFACLAPHHFVLIAKLLNEEVLRIDYLQHLLTGLERDLPATPALSKRTGPLAGKLQAQKQHIHDLFCQDAEAPENWKAMAAYVEWVEENPHIVDPSSLAAAADKAGTGARTKHGPVDNTAALLNLEDEVAGYMIAQEVFRSGALWREWEAFVEGLNVQWTVHVEVKLLESGGSLRPSTSVLELDTEAVVEFGGGEKTVVRAADRPPDARPRPYSEFLDVDLLNTSTTPVPQGASAHDIISPPNNRPVRVYALVRMDRRSGAGRFMHMPVPKVRLPGFGGEWDEEGEWLQGAEPQSGFVVPEDARVRRVTGLKKWTHELEGSYVFTILYSCEPTII